MQNKLFWYFGIFWMAMIAVGWLLFYQPVIDPARRNLLWPIWIVGAGFSFSTLLLLEGGMNWTNLLMVGGLAVYTASTIVRVRFCPHCGSMETGAGFFERPHVCTACGQPMDA